MADQVVGIDGLRKSLYRLFEILDKLEFQVSFMGMQPMMAALMDKQGKIIDPGRGPIPTEPVFLLIAWGLEKTEHPFWVEERKNAERLAAEHRERDRAQDRATAA
jgi:hypothetical protein